MNFYASPADFEEVLEYLTSIQFRLYRSRYRDEPPEYANHSEAMEHYRKDIFPGMFTVCLWQPLMGGAPIFEKRVSEKDNWFAYDTVGWGLIRINLELTNSLSKYVRSSWLQVNTESRAKYWEDLNPQLGKVDEWNWVEIHRLTNMIKRYIRSQASGKNGSWVILKGANKLAQEGYDLR